MTDFGSSPFDLIHSETADAIELKLHGIMAECVNIVGVQYLLDSFNGTASVGFNVLVLLSGCHRFPVLRPHLL